MLARIYSFYLLNSSPNNISSQLLLTCESITVQNSWSCLCRSIYCSYSERFVAWAKHEL